MQYRQREGTGVPVTREFSGACEALRYLWASLDLPSSGLMCVKSYLDEHCRVQSGFGLLSASIPHILNFEKM
jgi:hypothetical protein